MALREGGSMLGTALRPRLRPLSQCVCHRARRPASTAASDELEQNSSLVTAASAAGVVSQFDPLASSRARGGRQLPRSRYQYRPPKYYRGPLHPHQPPPPSDPASREFVPGPFSSSRLEQTYHSTIAPDILALAYTHYPPGFRPPTKAERLREWTGESPYFKNRPRKGPRGSSELPPLRKPITFRNVPKVTGVVVHSQSSEANEDSAYLHVAGMVIQAITNTRVETFKAKKAVNQWGQKKGKYVSVTATLKGEDMYDFLGRCIDLVLPRIKEWKGVRGSSGDSTGNISFGLDPVAVSYFPEIEVNYDMYPPKMIPGCHVTVQTSAVTDRDARLLLSSIGVPFYGKLVD
ncbi:ribosomal protein L5 [Rhizodiscina lignyota]|uniref:Large ribosomal subunit protein uL5m n=1 Tax=Rhizodiscina lignyota TaxID=1504668 RepID=A0A9P4I672_9PEZI|nr:ribosomal protein L5 [Rhizodiscina lignyota]